MGGRREEGGRVTRRLIHSVPVGFGSGIGLFLLWLDGWSVGGSRLGCLAGLVWSGLAGLAGCTLVWRRRSCYSFCSVLSVCSFRAVCCILYTVLVSVLSLRAFGIKLEMGDIELASCSYRQQLDDPDRATRLSTVACLVKVSWGDLTPFRSSF